MYFIKTSVSHDINNDNITGQNFYAVDSSGFYAVDSSGFYAVDGIIIN